MRHYKTLHAPLLWKLYIFLLLFYISTKYIIDSTDINSTTYKKQIYRIQQNISLRIQFINYIILRTLQVLISEFVFTLQVSRQTCCINIEVEGGGHDKRYKVSSSEFVFTSQVDI